MEENNNQEDDKELDVELTLQYLLAYTTDPELKKKLIDKISKNTNLSPEKTEEALKAILTVLINNSRSN